MKRIIYYLMHTTMKINRLNIIVAVILFFTGWQVQGQISSNELPVSFSLAESIELSDESIIKSLPVLNLEQIQQKDSEDEQNGLPPRFGFKHDVSYNLNNSGVWTILSNGDKIWKMEIYCPDALSINLLYDKFWIPEGAKFFIYSNDRQHSIGAFTSVNNKGTKENLKGFATGLVYGDRIILEYYLPRGLNEQGVISIAHVVHGYRYINIPDFFDGFGSSDDCHVNINCSEGQEWQKEKNAVALVLVGGERWCSGSLINTTAKDNSPFFLTADHCLDGVDAIKNPNAYYYSFYWHYEMPTCSNSNTEPPIKSTTGATVIANNESTDFALLYLTEDPKNVSGIIPYYLGWDKSGNAGRGGVGIHHPGGDVKKISTYSMTPINSYCANSNLYWDVNFISTANGHSVMQPGSSGSPLINSNHQIIGQLLGPYDRARCPMYQCDNPSLQQVAYGKFSVSWAGNGATDDRLKLQPWLDPLGTNVPSLNGLAACDGIIGELIYNQNITINETWNTDKYVIGTTNVENGATLNINNTTIRFNLNAKIIVKPGGKLIVDGAVLTSDCDGRLWQGVEVWGDPSDNYQAAIYQGTLVMKNSATIENAECAVSVGELSSGTKGGGIITANKSIFRNNRRAINYQPYTARNSNGNEIVNVGSFTECEFITDNSASFPASTANIMIYLCSVRDIAFNGCTFKDTRKKNTSSDYGIGIYANAASISMECLGLPRFGIILDHSFVPSKVNEFSGFGKAILMKDAGTKASKIHWTNFEDNNIAIYGSLVNKLSMVSCTIDLNDPANAEIISGRHGIYIEYSDGYTIANNQFKGNGTGLRIYESGEENNSVENNTFSDMCLAILASGTNGTFFNDYCSKGLTFHCNEFISNCEDIRIDNGISRIRFMQGSEYNAAGNIFDNSTIALNNTSSKRIEYYYDNRYPLHYPTGYILNNIGKRSVPQSNCNGIGYLGNYYYTRDYRIGTVGSGTGSFGAITMSYTSNGVGTNTGIYNASLTDGTTTYIDSYDGYVETLELSSIMNAYTEVYNEKNAELTAKISNYKAIYGEPINWDAVSFGEGVATVENPQVQLFVEISDLAQEVRLICREAISFLLNAKEFDHSTYKEWLIRENTLRSDYLLAQSYVERSEWDQANNVLQAIPEKFPNEYIESEHNDFIICLQFENQWGNTHPSEIPESEIAVIKNYLWTSNGLALAILKAILEKLLRELSFYTVTLDDKCGSSDCIGTDGFVAGGSSMSNHKSINSSNGNEQSLDDADSYSLAVYPNPSNGALHLNLENTTTVNIQQVDVYDIYGRELRKVENIGVHRTTVDLSGLSNGIYFIRVSMDNGETKIRRIVKE
jgi:parallel beta-helix repeat protein